MTNGAKIKIRFKSIPESVWQAGIGFYDVSIKELIKQSNSIIFHVITKGLLVKSNLLQLILTGRTAMVNTMDPSRILFDFT